MTRNATVYALRDPRSGAVKYVGSTVSPLPVRLRGHILEARRFGHSRRQAWLRDLQAIGLSPQIEALEAVSEAERNAAESAWHEWAKLFGALLEPCFRPYHRPTYRIRLRA